jgi:hypothetical protein
MGNFDDRNDRAPFSMVFHPSIPAEQIPYRYQVLRERARLNLCCYWRPEEDSRDAVQQVTEDGVTNISPEEPRVFEFVSVRLPPETLDGPFRTEEEIEAEHRPTCAEINKTEEVTVMGGWSHEVLPSFYVKPLTMETVLINDATSVPTKCRKSGAEEWNQGLNQFPPCNGAMTECPFYTGPKYKYINDEDIYIGEEILAEQIQELRFYIKNWKEFENPEEVWNESFEEPDICSAKISSPI